MALHLYATEFPVPLPDEVFHQGLSRLPAALQPKILRFRRWEDAHAALLGKLMLQWGLSVSGYPVTLQQLLYTAEAKPYFAAGPNFNISHSGNRVVCVLSTGGRIGLDIEAVKPLSFEDFQTQFRPNEWIAIRAAADPVAAFYRFWTAKESLIKADGRGLGIPLLELDVAEYIPVAIDGTTWHFQPLAFFPGYAAHLSSEEPKPEIQFHELDPTAIATGL